MSEIKSIAVYCGSSIGLQEKYQTCAARVGTLFAEKGIRLVYGGGSSGTMGTIADAALAGGGDVYGVITSFLYDAERGHDGLTELHVVQSMHDRKMMMFEASDAFVFLPGGLGTLDEAFEMLTWRQIGLHKKHTFFLNLDGYWDPLINDLIPHMIKEGFVREDDMKRFTAISSPEEIFEALKTPPVDVGKFAKKW